MGTLEDRSRTNSEDLVEVRAFVIAANAVTLHGVDMSVSATRAYHAISSSQSGKILTRLKLGRELLHELDVGNRRVLDGHERLLALRVRVRHPSFSFLFSLQSIL